MTDSEKSAPGVEARRPRLPLAGVQALFGTLLFLAVVGVVLVLSIVRGEEFNWRVTFAAAALVGCVSAAIGWLIG